MTILPENDCFFQSVHSLECETPDADEQNSLQQVPISHTLEAHFAKQLAGNEKSTRDRAFNELKEYMTSQSKECDEAFSRDEMIRIWKGLFYCMWMSDTPFVQEELARNMAGILTRMHNSKASKLYFEVFFITIEREWHGIDRLRLNKFLLLIRFMLEKVFFFLKKNLWDEDLVNWLIEFFQNGPLSPLNPIASRSSPIAVRLHFIDIYLEELTRIGNTTVSPEQVTKLLQPICILICETSIKVLIKRAVTSVFQELIDQSEPVRKALSDYAVVDETPLLKVDYKALADDLLTRLNSGKCRRANRRTVTSLIKKLNELTEGRVPLAGLPDINNKNNDQLDIKKTEEDITNLMFQRLEEERVNRRKAAGKHKKAMEQLKRKKIAKVSGLPYSNTKQDGVDFDAIVDAVRFDGDDEDDSELKKTRKSKMKVKKNKASNKNNNQNLKDIQPNDEVSSRKRKFATVTSPTISQEKLKSTCRTVDDNETDVVFDETAPKKKRRVQLIKSVSKTDIKLLNRGVTKKKVNTRLKRIKENSLLRKKLLEVICEKDEIVKVDSSLSKSIPVVKSGSKTFISKNHGDKEQKSKKSQSAFMVHSLTKLSKNSPKQRKKCKFVNSPKTPKRVSFQMSKIQVQPFKKTDRSCVLSPSPGVVAFDPDRTPNSGLLKIKSPTPLKKKAIKHK